MLKIRRCYFVDLICIVYFVFDLVLVVFRLVLLVFLVYYIFFNRFNRMSRVYIVCELVFRSIIERSG